MTLKEFYSKLSNHDWHYRYSSDSSVYRRGQSSEAVIQMAAKESPEHNKLYDEYWDYVFRDGVEKPTAPEDSSSSEDA